ncbi:replication restart helicase PriA [Proteiniphilum acetatigenes]|uniref:replication restart helicase PriA n=1 Tax=Proteiniphilum acetatigenes TaxID=294710 RepID=UPI0003757617|nr:primosomal protein N' [Proteiniphilum acetatigenes]SFK87603.1 replication restart DNA helicase PriA [Porphyromonadaceae bacterium KH3CP3RA]
MYADVILPLPLSGLFTYAVPTDMQHKIGRGFRVVVPFGRRKYYTAVVAKVHRQLPGNFTIKEIHSLIDSTPVVTDQQLELWEWVSFYYLSAQGDVCKAALPSPMMPEDLQKGYIQKSEEQFRLNPTFEDTGVAAILKRSPKQQLLLDEIIWFLTENERESISRSEVKELNGYTPMVLNGLIKKEILISFTVERSRLHRKAALTRSPYPLSKEQQKAMDAIQDSFSDKQTVLLHGATSSGKTEIYIHLIDQLLTEGKQTLYLLPEIALTTQLTHRLQTVFGNRIGIYHSGINDQERTEIWQKMLSETPYEIILGVRSSLFLPFRRLGLVIVDEEHETSYKQQEPSPRYHARDTAIMLAHMSNAKTLLGSATPSVESYYNAQTGKYGLVMLNERFGKIELPQISLQNTKDLRRRKKMKSVLAPALIEEINQALENGEQAILFRNRRGFAPMIECAACGWIPKCLYCDVTLTYHKREHRLICHYCNSSYSLPSTCPSCHSEGLKSFGAGTERLEEEVSQLFPGAVVGRMDRDTASGKDSFERIINDFQENRIQILIGTQMLSKGLDFGNVRVVGIIAADSLLNYPDFRSHERGFQLITQAAGRAGRRDKQGTVIIQTSDPEQPIYRLITRNDYEGFYHSQITERKLFKYPPFTRLISIVLKHKDEQKAEYAAISFFRLLRQSFENSVLGPNKPVVGRIQQQHIREILLKLDHSFSPAQAREWIKSAESRLRENSDFKQILLYYNVDWV